MTEFGRGHSGGRENNYKYTSSLISYIFICQVQHSLHTAGRTFFLKKYTPYYLGKMSKYFYVFKKSNRTIQKS